MSSVYTPDDTNNPADYTMPDDGDNEDVASVRVSLEGLADKIAYTQKNYPLDTTFSTFRVQPYNLTPVGADNEVPISLQWFSNNGLWLQGDISFTVGLSIDCPLELPNGSVLTGVTVYLNGKFLTGHTNLPANMPQIRVFKHAIATGAITALSALTTDSSGFVVDYDAPHAVVASVASEVISTDIYRYSVRVVGEHGTDSVPGLNILGIGASYSVTALDKGAA